MKSRKNFNLWLLNLFFFLTILRQKSFRKRNVNQVSVKLLLWHHRNKICVFNTSRFDNSSLQWILIIVNYC